MLFHCLRDIVKCCGLEIFVRILYPSVLTKRLFPITAKRIKKFNAGTCFNADKIRKAGFKQPIFLEEGFKRTLEWFKKRPQETLKRCENDSEL